MSSSTLQPSAQSSSLLRVDEELLAAAIHEMREADINPASAVVGAENGLCTNCKSFFLLILFELIFPGVKADTVLTFVQQFVVPPAIKHFRMLSEQVVTEAGGANEERLPRLSPPQTNCDNRL